MSEPDRRAQFERLAMPLLDDAVNLAVWLTGNRVDAEDIVQESMLRAFKYLDRFSGEHFRPWLLQIVRNTAMTWLARNRSGRVVYMADAEAAEAVAPADTARAESPEQEMLRQDLTEQINRAVADLPVEFREVIILREMQDLSYKEIAAVIDVPIGTVMSRLARARKILMSVLPRYAS
ncbi:MAG: sigma-70 family RNA polymerase sigma factor [Proteobacteria bacterium]|nr:sigma-70 family RNA polymerase sigma factor [Pseudomonadota bacterium]